MLTQCRWLSSLAAVLTVLIAPLQTVAAADKQPPVVTADEIIEIRGERQQQSLLSVKEQPMSTLFGGQQAFADLARSVTPISADLIAATAFK